jgi:hypothetical protein
MINRHAVQFIQDVENLNFSKEEYSRFKFGSKIISRKYGYELAESFLKSHAFIEAIKVNKQLVVLTSPYNHIPTATNAMCDYFKKIVNRTLIKNGKTPLMESKILRFNSYTEDYGAMNAEERFQMISRDGFYLDANFLKDKFCLFLDDIRITGSHEKLIEKTLETQNISNLDRIYLYYGILENDKVPAQFENELNYGKVKNLLDLNDIIKNESFILNTRATKFILNSNHDEFKNFIHYQRDGFVESLYDASVGNSYHLENKYHKNFQYLEKLVQEDELFVFVPNKKN